MADSKITGLSADTTPTSDDLVVTVNDPAGTPGNKKVTLANLALGVGGAWATWSPTLGNLSGGTQTYAKYIQIGKVIHFRFMYTLAGAGVAGEVTFSPPTTLATGYANPGTINGTATLIDTGSTAYTGRLLIATTTSIAIRCIHTDGARATDQPLSSSNPFAFGNGDVIEAHGTYESA